MAKPQTLVFAARHLADTVADAGEAGLLKALSGYDGFDPIPVIREHLAFRTPHESRPVSEDAVFLAALSYALGRMSAAVSIVADDIHANWDKLGDETKSEIKARISAAIDSGRAGMDMDRKTWETVLDLPGEAVVRP